MKKTISLFLMLVLMLALMSCSKETTDPDTLSGCYDVASSWEVWCFNESRAERWTGDSPAGDCQWWISDGILRVKWTYEQKYYITFTEYGADLENVDTGAEYKLIKQ